MPTSLPAFVWTDPSGSWTNPHPGILIAWRKVEQDHKEVWEGWVISAWASGHPTQHERMYVHQAWVAAGHMRIAEAPRPKPDLSAYRPVNSDRPR